MDKKPQDKVTDFARTSNTWHNQVVILKQQLQQLAAVIGSGLIQAIKPFVQQFNAALSGLIAFAQKVVNALGKIFGWEMEVNTKGLAIDDDAIEDGADAMGNLGDAADNASKATKELNKQLQGFDKLNVLTTKKDSSSSKKKDDDSKSGTGTAVVDTGDATAALKKTKGVFESEIDNLFDLGRYINKKLTDALNSIKWDAVYQKAREWAAGLAHFLNGLISPEMFAAIGRTLVNGLNTAFHFLDEFAKEFDWGNLGRSIGAGLNAFFGGFDWGTILSAAKRWGQGIATTINEAVRTTDFYQIGKTVMKMLETALTFAFELGNGIDFTQIGQKLADGINGAIHNFPAKKFADTIDVWVQGLWDMLVNLIQHIDKDELGRKIKELVSNIDPKTWRILIGGLLLIKGTSFAVSFGKELMSAISKAFIKKLAGRLKGDMATSPELGKAIGEGLGKAGGGATLGEATAEGGGFLSFLAGIVPLLAGGGLAIGSFVDQLRNGWSIVSEILKWIGLAIAAVGAVILGAPALVAGVVAAIVGVVMGLVVAVKENLGSIKEFFGGVWEGIKGFFSKIGALLGLIGGKIGEFVGSAVDTIGDFFGWIGGKLGEFVGWIGSLPGKIGGFISSLWGKITGFFGNVFGKISDFVSKAWAKITDFFSKIFGKIGDFISNTWSKITDFFGNIWGKIKDFFGSAWEKITGFFGSVKDKITGFSSTWGKIWDGIKNTFKKVWDSMANIIKKPINFIIGIVEKLVNGFTDGVNFIKKALNRLRFTVPDWIPGIGGKTVGFNFSMTPHIKIPRLEKGGFLPYGSSMFIAGEHGIPELLGTVNGKNAVAGGAEITGIRDEIHDSSNRQLANDNRIIQLLTIIAEKEFGISQDAMFRAVRNSASDYTMRTGRGAFEF